MGEVVMTSYYSTVAIVLLSTATGANCRNSDGISSLYVLLVIISFIVLIMRLVSALKRCCPNDGEVDTRGNSPEVVLIPASSHQYDTSRTSPPSAFPEVLTPIDSLHYSRRASHEPPSWTVLRNLQNESTRESFHVDHPITPPPAYNVAVLAPQAPLSQNDRIPSYEDVMSGKIA